jgi:hypothetical protein
MADLPIRGFGEISLEISESLRCFGAERSLLYYYVLYIM